MKASVGAPLHLESPINNFIGACTNLVLFLLKGMMKVPLQKIKIKIFILCTFCDRFNFNSI